MEAEAVIEGQETERWRETESDREGGKKEGGGVSGIPFSCVCRDFLFSLKGKTHTLRRAQGPIVRQVPIIHIPRETGIAIYLFVCWWSICSVCVCVCVWGDYESVCALYRQLGLVYVCIFWTVIDYADTVTFNIKRLSHKPNIPLHVAKLRIWNKWPLYVFTLQNANFLGGLDWQSFQTDDSHRWVCVCVFPLILSVGVPLDTVGHFVYRWPAIGRWVNSHCCSTGHFCSEGPPPEGPLHPWHVHQYLHHPVARSSAVSLLHWG